MSDERFNIHGNGVTIGCTTVPDRKQPLLFYRRDSDDKARNVGRMVNQKAADDFMDAIAEMCRAEWMDENNADGA